MSGASVSNLYTLPPIAKSLIEDSDHDALYIEGPITAQLDKDLQTPVLDELGHKLSFVARKSGDHIDPLHQHKLKERSIRIAEDPALHLIRYPSAILIKPLPPYLLNLGFWETNLLASARIYVPSGGTHVVAAGNPKSYDISTLSPTCRSALGFLRSYGFLIRHRSDLLIAQELHLIPPQLTFSQFQAFIAPFRSLPDAVVSVRYQYGQLRLSRLNLATRLLRPRSTGKSWPWFYHVRYWQTGDYLSKLGAPALFAFAAISLVLSSMQVVIAAKGEPGTWQAFNEASWGFGIAVIMAIPALGVCVVFGVLVSWSSQGRYALRDFRRATTSAS